MLVALLSHMLLLTSLHYFYTKLTSKMPISVFFSPVATVTILNKACHYHPSSQGIIFHVIASKVAKTPIFISNSPFISFFVCFLYQKCLNRKCSKLPHPPIYDTSVHFAVRTQITGLNSCGLLMVVRDIGGPPSGTSFQISNLIRMSSRYQK